MFRQDQNGGLVKELRDGRVLRITQRLYNTLLTISNSQEDPTWIDGW